MRKSSIGRSGKKRVGRKERYLTSGTLASGSPARKVGHESSIARGTPLGRTSFSSRPPHPFPPPPPPPSLSLSLFPLTLSTGTSGAEENAAGRFDPFFSFFFYFFFLFRRVVAPLAVSADDSPPPLVIVRATSFREERKFGRRPISAKRIAAGSWEPLPCYYARRRGEVRQRLSIIRYIGNEFRNGDPSIITAAREEKFGGARARPFARAAANHSFARTNSRARAPARWRLLHTRPKKSLRAHTLYYYTGGCSRFSLLERAE